MVVVIYGPMRSFIWSNQSAGIQASDANRRHIYMYMTLLQTYSSTNYGIRNRDLQLTLTIRLYALKSSKCRWTLGLVISLMFVSHPRQAFSFFILIYSFLPIHSSEFTMSAKKKNLDLYLGEVFKQFIAIKDDDYKKSQEVFKGVFDQVKAAMGDKCNYYKKYSRQVILTYHATFKVIVVKPFICTFSQYCLFNWC